MKTLKMVHIKKNLKKKNNNNQKLGISFLLLPQQITTYIDHVTVEVRKKSNMGLIGLK